MSSNIIRVIKSRRMRWEGQVARMGYRRERKAAYRILVKKLEGKNHSGNLGVWEINIILFLQEFG